MQCRDRIYYAQSSCLTDDVFSSTQDYLVGITQAGSARFVFSLIASYRLSHAWTVICWLVCLEHQAPTRCETGLAMPRIAAWRQLLSGDDLNEDVEIPSEEGSESPG